MSSRKIILLNGCPGVGKDEIANYLAREYNYKTIAFKDKAYLSVAKHYNISLEDYMQLYLNKDTPTDILDGLSPRKAMQYVVQDVNKPKLGRDYLARDVLDEIRFDKESNYVVSDFGLDEEEIQVHYKLSRENYVVINIQREGHTYEFDTRSERMIIHHIIYNDGSTEELYEKVRQILNL